MTHCISIFANGLHDIDKEAIEANVSNVKVAVESLKYLLTLS